MLSFAQNNPHKTAVYDFQYTYQVLQTFHFCITSFSWIIQFLQLMATSVLYMQESMFIASFTSCNVLVIFKFRFF